MKRVLLIVYMGTHFIELIRVARLLKQSSIYQPIFLFENRYSTMVRDLKICQVENFPCFDATGKTIAINDFSGQLSVNALKQQPEKKWRWFYNNIINFLREHISQSNLFLFPLWLWRCAHNIWFSNQFIKQKKIDVIVLAIDNVKYNTGEWVKAANNLGVSSLIVPFAMTSIVSIAEEYYEQPAYSLNRWSNWLAGKLYPHWVYQHKNRKLLCLPAPQVFAKEWLKLAPPLPWSNNSSLADAVVVESGFMLQHYQKEGLTADKLVFTGALYEDVLYENMCNASTRRAALCKKLGWVSNRLLILTALTPNKFGLPNFPHDFENYADLVQFWVQSLTSLPNCNIVFCLHPSQNYEDIQYIEQWGGKIVQQDTATLIPLCDIYVVDCSATTRWAVACGKPVVNYDVYRYRFPYYAEGDGVLSMEDKETFIKTLQNLTCNHTFYNKLLERQQNCMHKFGQLDGQAASRTLQLFDNLTTQKKGE